MNYKNISNIILFLLLSTFIASCSSNSVKEDAEEHHEEEANTVTLTESQYKTAGIELGNVEQRQLSGTIKVNGMLDVPPQQLISISVPLGGFLKSTSLLQGTKVKKGQVIATVENLEFIQMQQDYLEAKTQFEFAKADYERQAELAKENVSSEKTVQQAKANYGSWLAKTNGLRAKLKMININLNSLEEGNFTTAISLYAPITGYVTEVNVNIGKFVNPSDILFEIVDTEHLHAELTVFEKDVPKLKIGQKVRFMLANETRERMATVYLIGREIGTDRTIRIHCHIDQEDTNLLPGMYLNALVETAGVEVSSLPDQAIMDFQGKKYIFYQEVEEPESTNAKNNEHHFIMLEIQIGNSELGFTEIVLPDDFPANAKVVIKNAYAILSKMKNSEEEGH